MADLSSVSISDLATAIRERCSTPQDLQLIQSKLDVMSGQACTDAMMAARDASNIREEVQENRSSLYNRIGESERYASQNKDALSAEHAQLDAKIADTKFQIHDNIVKQGTDIAKSFGVTDKNVMNSAREISSDVHHIEDVLQRMSRQNAECCCETQREILKGNNQIERQVERSERWMEREFRDRMDNARDDVRDLRAEQALAFAAVAKAQAECCCETKLLIKDTAAEAEKTATANYTSLTAQIAALSREMEKSFCALNTKDLERDLADKQADLTKAQAELSNMRQTNALIEALGRKGHRD